MIYKPVKISAFPQVVTLVSWITPTLVLGALGLKRLRLPYEKQLSILGVLVVNILWGLFCLGDFLTYLKNYGFDDIVLVGVMLVCSIVPLLLSVLMLWKKYISCGKLWWRI